MKIHFSLPQSSFLQLAKDVTPALILPLKREVRNMAGAITDIQNCGELVCTLSIIGTHSVLDIAKEMSTKRLREASLQADTSTGLLSDAKHTPNAAPSAKDVSTVLKMANEARQARCALEVKVLLLPKISPDTIKDLDYSQPVIARLLAYEATNIFVEN